MMQALELLRLAKGTYLNKVTRIIEEIRPVALAISELCFFEGISMSDSQSMENSVKKELFKNT